MIGISKLGHLFQKVVLLFNVLEHLLSCEHFIENESGAPNITLFIIGVEIKNLRGSIKRSAYTFGHFGLNVSGQSKIGYLELSIFVEENIIRLEIPVYFI